MGQPKNTSWQNVSAWYNKSVGLSGNYYHQHLVIPNSLRLLNLKPADSVLDIACGQGVLAGAITKEVEYYGIDLAPDLIKFAKAKDHNPRHHYAVADAQKPIDLNKNNFSHASIILALQNIEDPQKTLLNLAPHLSENGKLLIVLNHPMFRIPRQSSWAIDPGNKLQYRRVNLYLSPLKIPVNANPGRGDQGPITWSFHHPLQDYFLFLKNSGFVVTDLEEWASDKESEGKAAKMENRGRAEFPLFMALLARKQSNLL